MTTGKNIPLTRWAFVSQGMSLLSNMMSRLAIAFLPKYKWLSILWLQSLFTVILETKKIKSLMISIVSPSICHEFMGPDVRFYFFWMLSFKPAFSLFSFTFNKRLFGSSLLSAIKILSSAYLMLLIILPEILTPTYASSSPAFCMIYFAYKLNKQDDNIQPWCTPFLIWNQSIVPCLVLTVASWPTYRFLRRKVKWSGIPISWRIFHRFFWSTQSKAFL